MKTVAYMIREKLILHSIENYFPTLGCYSSLKNKNTHMIFY